MKTKSLLLLSLLSTSVYAYGSCNKCGHSHVHDGHAHQHTPATNKSGFYVQGNIGSAFPASKPGREYNDRFKPAGVLGAGVGYNFSEAVSIDAAVAHRYKFQYADVTRISQSLSSTSVMVTGYYTFTTKTISPYLATGLGMSFSDVGTARSNAPDVYNGRSVSSFAWQVGTGIKFIASTNMSFDLGYRYVDSGSFKTSSNGTNKATDASIAVKPLEGKLRTHEVLLGVVYKL